jgi:uncharacterized protein (TIGR00661 family)
MIRIAYFISPHGFGHAARAAAVMNAVHNIQPQIHFDLYTLVPRWFFEDSTPGIFTYHEILTDIGLVQLSPLEEDIPATIQKLENFLPFSNQTLTNLQNEMIQSRCQLVICDISPLGIAAAEIAGIPSVLIENFTWDWIYEPYKKRFPQFSDVINRLTHYFNSADFHIQTRPVCSQEPTRNLVTKPVSRTPNQNRDLIRQRLGIDNSEKVILVSMGGIQQKYTFLSKIQSASNYRFVIPGGSETPINHGNLILLPFHSNFYHPDLLHASDAVVGKAGYSTIAEAYHAGIPFGFVSRSQFRESSYLVDFIKSEMYSIQITEETFHLGNWTDIIPNLMQFPKINRNGINGAEQTADYISGLIFTTKENDIHKK